MNILYVSPLCSERKIDNLFRTGKIKPEIAVQKFHKLMTRGFVLNDCQIETITACPVSSSTNSRLFWKKETEKIDGVTFNYLPFINYPFLRQLSVFIFGFTSTVLWMLKHRKEEKAIICDVLNIAVSGSALMAARLFRIQVVGIVTDLPGMMVTTNTKKMRLLRKFAPYFYKKSINSYTSYVLLTKQMGRLVNPFNRPSCIIEGVVDVNMNIVQAKKDKTSRTIIYAGGLYEEYGVRQLIEAFRQVKGDDLRLSVYGSGALVNEMDSYVKLDSRLHYYGTVTNAEVMNAELKATLLVNPRFTDAEFTKYSFPSKNLEYMVSGVPVLTTRLPGMPKDYYEYIYLFIDESLEGFTKTLSYVISLPDESLATKGQCAKDFVLREKNNVYQTNKILEMIKREALHVEYH